MMYIVKYRIITKNAESKELTEKNPKQECADAPFMDFFTPKM